MGPVCVCMGVDQFMVNWLWLYLAPPPPPPPTLKIVPTPLLPCVKQLNDYGIHVPIDKSFL